MRTLSTWRTLAAGIALLGAMGGSAFAQDSAKPVNPNGIGEVSSFFAQNTGGVGDTRSNLATNSAGPGLAAEVQAVQKLEGSNPTPPPNPDLDTPLPVEPH